MLFFLKRISRILLVPMFLAMAGGAWSAEPVSNRDLSSHLLEKVGAWKGVVSLLGAGDAALGLEMARTGDFLVHVVDPDPALVSQAQKSVDVPGIYGKTLWVDRRDRSRLPYGENQIDFVFATHLESGDLSRLPLAEILRVLCPRGKALIGAARDEGIPVTETDFWGWADGQVPAGATSEIYTDDFGVWFTVTKPPLAGVDEWTHWEKTPGNNPVSNDQVIKAPYMTQFMSQPYYIAMPAITTAAGGRTFIAMGHIAHHEREEPWLNTLLARNGYNGTELWRMKLPDGYMVHRSAFIATEKAFYMIAPDGNGVLVLDPLTGDEIDRIRIRGQRGDWKWIAMLGDTLYALVGEEKDPAETTLVRSTFSHWSWEELSKGYYEKQVPWGFGRDLLAYDLSERKVVWSHQEEKKIDSRALVMGAGRLFFYTPESRIGALDAATGAVAWTNDSAETRDLIEEPGVGLTSTPGFRSSAFSIYTPQSLVFQGQTRMNVVAVSPDDGHLLWSKKKTTNNPNMIYLDGKLLVGIGEEGSTLMVDPLTGEVLEDLGFYKRACARLTATPDSLFVRGLPDGLTRYDRECKEALSDGAMRPSCNDGAIGANGLLYMGPWLCDCNLSLMGGAALCSAGDFDFTPELREEERLQLGQGDPLQVVESKVAGSDWPTYRGGFSRSAAQPVEIDSNISPVWSFKPATETHPTAPVIAEGRVFLAGRDGKVKALSATSGSLEWAYPTGGPILQPPTVWEGRVFVGSGDGWIYSLEAATGRLLWRFRASPVERRIMLYGSLCSTWPVNTGCLVEDGTLYAGAGFIDYNGTYVYALDAKTGKLKWANDRSGHLDWRLRKGVSAQGDLAVLDGKLWMPGGNVVSPAIYDLQTGEYLGKDVGDGSPQSNRGQEIGIVADKYVIYGGRLLYSSEKNVTNPGEFEAFDALLPIDKRTLSKVHLGQVPATWDEESFCFVDGIKRSPTLWKTAELVSFLDSGSEKERPRPEWVAQGLADQDTVTLALAKNVLITVSEDPIERTLKARWLLSALDRRDGSVLWQQTIPGEAVPGALAIDSEGRMVVTLADGGAVCFGTDETMKKYVAALRDRIGQQDGSSEEAVAFLLGALDDVHSPSARQLLIEALDGVGVEVGREARENGYLTRWNLLAPIPWDPNGPADQSPVGEPKVDLSATHRQEGMVLNWRRYATNDPRGMINLEKIFGPLTNVAALAYTEIPLEEDKDLFVHLGSNDGFVCWWNEEEVGRYDNPRGYVPDQDTLKVEGKKGTNRLLVKVFQNGFRWGFGVRVTDKDERPLKMVQAD